MKTLKIITAIFLAALTVFFTGCNSGGSESSASSTPKYVLATTGVYAFCMFQAFQMAMELVPDSSGDILSQQVEEDGKKTDAEKWIREKAKYYYLAMYAADKMFKELDLVFSQTDEETALQQTSTLWNGEQGEGGYGTVLSGFGITQTSLNTASSRQNIITDKLFRVYYNPGGIKAISDAEIKEYYIKEFSTFSRLPVDLYKIETDDSGQSEITQLPEKEVKEIEKTLLKYRDKINGGVAFKDAVAEYKEEKKLTGEISYTQTDILKELSLPEDILEKVTKIPVGKSDVIKLSEGEQSQYILFYMADTAKVAYKLGSDADMRYNVLYRMKYKEFYKMIDDYAEKNKSSVDTAPFDTFDLSVFTRQLSTAQ